MNSEEENSKVSIILYSSTDDLKKQIEALNTQLSQYSELSESIMIFNNIHHSKKIKHKMIWVLWMHPKR